MGSMNCKWAEHLSADVPDWAEVIARIRLANRRRWTKNENDLSPFLCFPSRPSDGSGAARCTPRRLKIMHGLKREGPNAKNPCFETNVNLQMKKYKVARAEYLSTRGHSTGTHEEVRQREVAGERTASACTSTKNGRRGLLRMTRGFSANSQTQHPRARSFT